MAGRDRTTYTFRHGVTPETMSVISSKNKIYARPADNGDSGNWKQIGVVASFDPSETRTIEPVRGIGFGDHVAELVPGATDPMTLSVVRTAQYISLLYQVFGYKGGIDGIVRSLRHHKWPFDIYQEIVLSNLEQVVSEATDSNEFVQDTFDGNFSKGYQAIVTAYEGCWFSDYSTSFAADTALVQENVSIMVTDIIAGEGAEYLYTEDSDDLFNNGSKSNILSTSFSDGTNNTNA